MKDYYSLLGIERNATKVEIKKNYRLLATKYHPDKNQNPDSAKIFIAITEAYDILSNKKSRAQYDLFVWEKLKQNSAKNSHLVVPPTESTRTRRNKAQKKRSIKYHKETVVFKKSFKLVIESFYLVARYVLYILGISLLLVIIYSLIGHMAQYFDKGIIPAIMICGVLGAVSYFTLWVIKYALFEIKLDIDTFAAFYKISKKRATFVTASSFGFFLIFYIILLKIYF